jgi:hypothetical protein
LRNFDPVPDDGQNIQPGARAKGKGEYAPPVKVVEGRFLDAATAASVCKILRSWYGNLNTAADALNLDRRDLWRWSKGREPMPAWVITKMAAHREQAEARRREVIRARVEKAQRQADAELAKLREARRDLERLIDAAERTGGVLGWSRHGYVTPERAILVRQADRRRAVHGTPPLRQP